VTVLELAESNPATSLYVPASVMPWKEVDVAFQVGGRVAWVVEADQDLVGPRSSGNDEPLDRGDKIAQLEKSRYVAARALAAANLEAARAQVKATSLQATHIIPRRIDAAASERDRAQSQLERILNAAKTSSVANSEVDDARAARETSVANYRSAVAEKDAKLLELEVHQAQQERWSAALQQTDLDLEDTELHAPFDARVSRVHVAPGAVVAAGTPIATLVVMDPVKLELVVSAAKDGLVKTNDEVLVHQAELEPIPAIVYQKSAVANSKTRTFTVTLLCRNRFADSHDSSGAAVRIKGFSRPQRLGAERLWFLDKECIHSDSAGHFAWRVLEPNGRLEDKPLDLERINLKLEDIYTSFAGQFNFRQLSPEDPLCAGLERFNHTVLAAGVPANYTGGQVIKNSRCWQLRPGEIAHVQLDANLPPRGIYVDKRFIRADGDNTFVFLVGGDDQKPMARMVPIKIVAHEGELQCIEGTGIKPGVRLITTGVHFLHDGAEIQILEVEQ
jgi:biotin carboxyl carrier protein